MGSTEITVDSSHYQVDWHFDYDKRADTLSIWIFSDSVGTSKEWIKKSGDDFAGEWDTLGTMANGETIQVQLKTEMNSWATGYWKNQADALINFYISEREMYYGIFLNFRTGVIFTELYADNSDLIRQTTWDTGVAFPSFSLLDKSSSREPAKKATKENFSNFASGGILAGSMIAVTAALCVFKRKRGTVDDDFARV